MGIPQRNHPIPAGTKVQIGSTSFFVERLLGTGSFGSVWAATSTDGQLSALKQIVCRTEGELRRVAAERQLLSYLSLGSVAVNAGRLPCLLASEAEPLSNGSWCIRLAMTRVPGIPLASYLKSRVEDFTSDGRGEVTSQRFLQATEFSMELMRQLAPALESLSQIAYHRDITPRNILVDSGSSPSFGLVDFGLAVDAKSWESDEGFHDIGGDGLYWTTSAWFAFANGVKELAIHSELYAEYKTCLDMHSFGLSALSCFMELSGLASSDDKMLMDGFSEATKRKLRSLKAAWNRYWSDVKRFWQPVFEAFRIGRRADCEALKAAYAQAAVYKVVMKDLRSLRSALSGARDAFRAEAQLRSVVPLLDALLILIRPGSCETDESQLCWRTVIQLLQGFSVKMFQNGPGSPYYASKDFYPPILFSPVAHQMMTHQLPVTIAA
jgi:serine/threonine protein kinase